MGIGMKPPFAACLLALLLALSASLDIEENPDLGTGISELVGEGRRACSGTSSWDAIDASATSNTAGNDEEDDELGVSVLDLARVKPAAKPQAKPAAKPQAKPAANPKAQAEKEKKYTAELKKVVVTSTTPKPLSS